MQVFLIAQRKFSGPKDPGENVISGDLDWLIVCEKALVNSELLKLFVD